MDELDNTLVMLLGQDARMPVTDLAARLGVSRATVQNRIARLRHSGVIARFTIQLGAQAEDRAVSALILIKTQPGDSRPFIATLKRMPEVTDIHSLNGAYDFVIEARCPTLGRLDALLDRIRALPAVAETQTSIRLSRLL